MELEREYRAVIDEILELRQADGRVREFVRSIRGPGALADASGYAPDLTFEQKLELLQELDVTARLEKALAFQRERLAELQVRTRIRDDVEAGAQAQQREYFLRKQMESIRKELGEDDEDVVEEYRSKIEDADMPATCASRPEGARAPRAHGRAERRVLDDPHLPGLASGRPVGRDLR